MSDDGLTFVGVGDVGPVTQPVDRLADLVLPTFESVDFRIAQCERTYSTRGAYPGWMDQPGGVHTRQDADSKLARAGRVAVGDEPIVKTIGDRPQQRHGQKLVVSPREERT